MDLVDAPWTVERFIAWEDRQEGKHEFDGTRIVPMNGGSYAHQTIVDNLRTTLRAALDRNRYGVAREMRLRLGDRVRYPEICVVPGPIGQRVLTLSDVVVLFEVLSGDTAETDRFAKRREYATLTNASRYVLVEQDRMGATNLRRDGNDWIEEATDPDAIEIPELGIPIPYAAIYAELSF